MRIDAHQHFWQWNAEEYPWIDNSMAALRRDFLPADLAVELKAAGFDASVCVQARQNLQETRWLLDLASASPFVAGVVGWVDLRVPQIREQLAEFSLNPKFLGVRHVVQDEPDPRFMLQPAFLRGISALEEFGLTYDILIYHHHLPVAAQLVQQFPRQVFVLDHIAKPQIKAAVLEPWATELRELANSGNVYCKLSGMVTEADWKKWKMEDLRPYLDVAFECFGPDRLMIGSDWPVCTVAGSYSEVMKLVMEYLGDYPEARDAVLGGNAQRLWKLGDRGQSSNSVAKRA